MTNIKKGIIDIFPQVPENFFDEPKRVKLGFDPTTNELHLGHTVLLRKISQFAQMEHKPIIIIGDFTARIGDPTGKAKTRKQLSKEEVAINVDNIISAISKFIKINDCEIVFNSNHLSSLTLEEIISLQSSFTVNQLLHKEDFKKRFLNEIPISLHELMYPILQGYDSHIVNADIELGGIDQKFNVTAGRIIQNHMNSNHRQVGMLMPILVGTDGKEKMSKSLGNTIGIGDSPLEMFSKLEKIPDNAVDSYITLLTDLMPEEFSMDSREKQKQMAFEVTKTFFGDSIAKKAQSDAQKVIVSKSVDVEAERINVDESLLPILLANLLLKLNFTKTTSEGRRMIKSGAVKINGEKIIDEKLEITKEFDQSLVQLSRTKFFRLCVNS